MGWTKLNSVCTYGVPAFTGKKSGCLALLEQCLGRTILEYHCIIHQEDLSGKTVNLKHVMDIVLRCEKQIRSKALYRRELRQFLLDMNEEYGELLLHCEISWLPKGEVLSRFWALKKCLPVC